jgi:D-alanyl-D-alanine carboxypeptidase
MARSYFILKKIIKKEKVDIVHSHARIPSFVCGLLKKRMKDTPAQINIHAKTGTLTGISSLAGYAIAANNHILAFSIINQGVMKNEQGRNFQDKVCAALCK